MTIHRSSISPGIYNSQQINHGKRTIIKTHTQLVPTTIIPALSKRTIKSGQKNSIFVVTFANTLRPNDNNNNNSKKNERSSIK